MRYLQKSYSVFLLIFLTVVMVGCVATQEDVGGLYARQNKLEARMERLNEQVDVLKKKNFGAEAGTSNVGNQVFQLETKLYELEQQISGMDNRIDNIQGEIRSLKRSAQESAKTQQSPGSSSDTSVSDPPAEREPELSDYDKGYRNLSEGKYKLAREQFNSYIKNNPGSAKSPDALFWIADSYYRERKYEEAILEYQNLIDSYPKDSRVPLAYLKQGLSLLNLDKNEDAKLFFETLIDKYPDSEEAEEARKKLQSLDSNG